MAWDAELVKKQIWDAADMAAENGWCSYVLAWGALTGAAPIIKEDTENALRSQSVQESRSSRSS